MAKPRRRLLITRESNSPRQLRFACWDLNHFLVIAWICYQQLHGRAFVFHSFHTEITGPKSKKRSSALNRVLEQLLELYLVNVTLKNMGDILRVSSLGIDHCFLFCFIPILSGTMSFRCSLLTLRTPTWANYKFAWRPHWPSCVPMQLPLWMVSISGIMNSIPLWDHSMAMHMSACLMPHWRHQWTRSLCRGASTSTWVPSWSRTCKD